MDVLAFGGRVLLALVFVTAAVGKLVDQPGARGALSDFRVPQALVVPFGWLLPLAELTVAVALLVQPLARVGSMAAAALLLVFMAGIGAAMSRGEAPDCNCFGQIGSAPAGRGTLIRNAVLATVAIVVAAYGAGKNPGSWVSHRTAAEVLTVVLGLLVVALAAAYAALWTERRTMRSDLARANESLAAFPPGLPVGADAPRFALPEISGTVISLDDLRLRGRPVALVFASPTCAPCRHMFPDISRWQRTLADRLTIVVLATGSVADARTMSAEFGLTDVLVQSESEVFQAYRASATPSVVIVNPDGRIGTRIRSSQGVVEAAIRSALQTPPPSPASEGELVANGVGRDGPPLDVTRWSGRGAQPV